MTTYKTLPVPTTVLIAIITFLIGGFAGDWGASSKLDYRVVNNAKSIAEGSQKDAVMEVTIQNIENIVKEIKVDVKEIKHNK